MGAIPTVVQTPDPDLPRDERDLSEVGLSVKGWPATPLRDLVAGLKRLRSDLEGDMKRRVEADSSQGVPESARPYMWAHHAIDLVTDEIQRQDGILGRLEED